MKTETTNMHIYIAVAVALIFFVVFFGNRFFPFTSRVVTVETPVQDIQIAEEEPAPPEEDVIQTEQVIAEPVTLLNGLVQILDIKKGEGIEAVQGSTVRVGYVGVYADEQTGETVEFDKNTDPAQGFEFTLGAGMVIPGFETGIAGMREGGARVIVIDPQAGYGDRQVGLIPPNTTLQFIVELYEVRG